MAENVGDLESNARNSCVGRLMKLCPQYDEAQHSMYVELLEHAVYQDGLSNVALAGPYGSGKSSILNRFRENHSDRCISIGLSTLAPKNVGGGGQGSPQVGGAAGYGCACDQEGLTNELEREIVRQLLYQGDPSKTPKSRFNRIHPTSKFRQMIISLLVSLAIVAILIMALCCTGNTVDKLTRFVSLEKSHLDIVAILLVFLTLCLSAIIYKLVIPKMHRFTIGGLSAMGATIKLEKGSFSYFDQYLDEILYFFEANDYDTVIFEDLDRFDNPLIFEQLRELNFLLNNASGIKKKRGQIHFIYALRDSVFEPGSFEATGEYSSFESKGGTVPGSGRVKFFDGVVPLMPFLSDLSAYDHMKAIFKEELVSIGDGNEREWFDRCLRTVAPLIADMRLIKAIYNEYLVLLAQMGPHTSRGANLALRESAILAISIFKNIHPREFEKARVGNGWLNEVYEAYFIAVEARVSALKEEMAWCNSSELADKATAERAAMLGDKLNRAMTHIFVSDFILEMNSRSYGNGTVKTPDFWDAFISMPDDREIGIRHSQGYYHSQVTFTKSQLTFLMGIKSEDLALFNAAPNSEARRTELQGEIDALLGADYPDVKGLICPRDSGDGQAEFTFEEVVLRGELSMLAAQLVLNGFIGKDYRLYTALFPDEGRASVINFITNHVNHNRMAIDFPLNEGDCAELVKRLGVDQYENTCTFNCDLLAYLVCNERNFAKMMMRSACRHFDEEGRRLLESFIAGRDEGCWLNDVVLGTMSAELDNIIPLIVNGVVPRDYRLKAICLALEFLDEEKVYSVEGFSRWLTSIWKTLRFDENLLTPTAFRNALVVFETSGFEVPALSNVGFPFAREIIDRGLFAISRKNLQIATGGVSVPPLNQLFEQYRLVYNRVVRDSRSLGEYLSCLEAGDLSFSSFEHQPFVTCVSLADSNDAMVGRLIERCGKGMLIHDACDLVSELLDESVFSRGPYSIDLLVKHGRIAPTSHNVSCMLNAVKESGDEQETLDAADSLMVNQAFVASGDLVGEISVKDLVLTAIRCSELNDEEVARRIGLLVDVYSDEFPIPVNGVWDDLKSREDLFVRLLEMGALGKPIEAYKKLRNAEWSLRERCLKRLPRQNGTSKVIDYFPEDIARIVRSEKLDELAFRDLIINNPKGVLDGCGADIDDYADVVVALVATGHAVSDDMFEAALSECASWDHLEPWLVSEIPLQYKVDALACCISRLTSDQLEEALKKLGGQYAEICDRSTYCVKLSPVDSNRKIASAAEGLLEIVSSVSTVDGKPIRINKRTSMLNG